MECGSNTTHAGAVNQVGGGCLVITFLYETEVPYISHYSFMEHVVALEPPGERERRLYSAYKRLADAIVLVGLKADLLSGVVHDLFIGFAEEDRGWVTRLGAALEGQGRSVRLRKSGDGGNDFAALADAELAAARCVLVIWSSHSMTSHFVLAIAEEARERGVLIPVMAENAQLALRFRSLQAADFTNWSDDASDLPCLKLQADISLLVGPSIRDQPGSGTAVGEVSESSLRSAKQEGVDAYRINVFIAYSQQDRAWVKRLVNALTAEGWDVWWDLKIRSGESFDEAIERTRKQVVWWPCGPPTPLSHNGYGPRSGGPQTIISLSPFGSRTNWNCHSSSTSSIPKAWWRGTGRDRPPCFASG